MDEPREHNTAHEPSAGTTDSTWDTHTTLPEDPRPIAEAVARRILPSSLHSYVDDIAGAICIKVLRYLRMPDAPPIENFRTFVASIAFNHCLDLRKSAAIRRRVDIQDIEEIETDSSEFSSAFGALLLQEVYEYMQSTLSPREFQVYLLYHGLDETDKQIAEELKISTNQVRYARLKAAIKLKPLRVRGILPFYRAFEGSWDRCRARLGRLAHNSRRIVMVAASALLLADASPAVPSPAHPTLTVFARRPTLTPPRPNRSGDVDSSTARGSETTSP